MKSPIDSDKTPRRQPFAGDGNGATHEDGVDHVPLATQTIRLDALAALAGRMSDGVCLLSADGHIQFANTALRAMLGRSKAELLGARLDEFRQDMPEVPDTGQDVGGADHAQWVINERVTVCQWRRGDGGVFAARCAMEPLAIEGEPSVSVLLMTPVAYPESGEKRGKEARQAEQAERVAARRWVEVIEAIADVTLSPLSPNDMIEAMLNRILPALDLENAAVLLLNDAGDALETRVIAGVGREFVSMIRVPLDGKVVSGVIHSREPLVVNGAGELMRESGLFPEPLLASMSVRSMLLTPLIVEDQVTGLLYLGARELDHFTIDDVRLARVAGSRVALAVEGARAHEAEALAREEVTRSQRRLVLLAEAIEALVGPLDPGEIARRLVSFIAPAFVSACALYLVEDDGVIRRTAMSGPDATVAGPGEPDAETARALARLPLEIENFEAIQVSEQAGDHPASADDMGASRRVLVEAHGHPQGALYLIEGMGRRIAQEDLTLIHGLARRAAVGMEIARLYAELEQALKRVSESAIQLDTIFDSTDAGIYVTDASGHFTRINTYGSRMLGLSDQGSLPARNRMRALFELRDDRGNSIPPEEEPIYIARVRNMPVERRVIIHHFDTGDDIPALARCTPMRDGRGQVIGAVGVLMDITGIHELERQKDEFLGIVSHELKTPLTTLKILSQMLARRMHASNEPRAQEQAERMTTAIVRMERLINDLLDVSRIQEGRLAMTLTVCDLGAICRDAVREQEITSQRPIHLSLPDSESLPVHADIERLRQVVVNLLSNALKYSPANMPVSLRVREVGGKYLVSVEDHGPGLPLNEQRRLFQRFYRAPSVHVQSGSGVGLGLGLFISREIVLNHGGDIWVESEPGHGCVFTFSVPRAGNDARDAEGQDG